jgi:hypothetical protein
MILVKAQVTPGPPFQVDDFPTGAARSTKGALHLRPGLATMTVDEFDHVMSTVYGKRLVELDREGLPEPAAKPDVIVPLAPEPPPPAEKVGASDEATPPEPSEPSEPETEGNEAGETEEASEGRRKKRKKKKRSS